MNGQTRMICSSCGTKSPIESGLKGWRGSQRNDGKADPLCPACAEGVADTISMEGIVLVDSSSPDAPMAGAFRPIREGQDLHDFVATIPFGQLWREVEIQLTLELQDLERDSYSIAFDYDQWPGLTFTIQNLPGGKARFAAPARDKSKTPRLDVYQVYRLRRMGLTEADDGQTWVVELSEKENTARNIAQIVVQLGVFVYSVVPNWIQSVDIR